MRGIFENGQPRIEIEISGAKGVWKRLTALVDSGFNGHVQIPFLDALPLGLVLAGTHDGMLADGLRVQNLLCEGRASLGGATCDIFVDVVPAEIVLIGTALLAKLKKTLVLDCALGTVEISG